LRSLEFESSVKGEVSAERHLKQDERTWDDLVYMVLGDATAGNILVMVFAVVFFGATPVAMLLLFGTYSDGMRWLIGLGLIAAMGFMAVYIMRMGLAKDAVAQERSPAKTQYPGELTHLTEAMERAADGYAYSQQVIRERLCNIIVSKEAQARNMGEEEILDMLEAGKPGILDDTVLDDFLRQNRPGALAQEAINAKGRSRERGVRFMAEIDNIIGRIEAMT
jgi:hypothetical protein